MLLPAAIVVLLTAAGGARAAPQPQPLPPPPPTEDSLLAMQLGAGSGASETEDAPLESQQGILLHDNSAAPPEPKEPSSRSSKGSSGWARSAVSGAGAVAPLEAVVPGLAAAAAAAGLGAAGLGALPPPPVGRRLPRYRTRKLLPLLQAQQQPLLDRHRKLKVLRRQDALARPLADQPDVYVVDETVTGYAADSSAADFEPGDYHAALHGGGGGVGFLPAAFAPLSPLPPPPSPLHLAAMPPDAAAALLAGAWLEDDDALHVRHRLQKLDFYFSLLRILSEDCRQRVLCETAREPDRFSPLSAVLGEVTSFTGSYQYVTSHLINTTEGARLLSYMEASFRGQDRARSCAVFQYRCPSRTEDMINYDALCLWREMVRWLTIHVVARPP